MLRSLLTVFRWATVFYLSLVILALVIIAVGAIVRAVR